MVGAAAVAASCNVLAAFGGIVTARLVARLDAVRPVAEPQPTLVPAAALRSTPRLYALLAAAGWNFPRARGGVVPLSHALRPHGLSRLLAHARGRAARDRGRGHRRLPLARTRSSCIALRRRAGMRVRGGMHHHVREIRGRVRTVRHRLRRARARGPFPRGISHAALCARDGGPLPFARRSGEAGLRRPGPRRWALRAREHARLGAGRPRTVCRATKLSHSPWPARATRLATSSLGCAGFVARTSRMRRSAAIGGGSRTPSHCPIRMRKRAKGASVL